MNSSRMTPASLRLALTCLCVLLSGCPGDTPAGSPGSVPAQTTAPTLPNATPAGTKPQTTTPGAGAASSQGAVQTAPASAQAQQVIDRAQASYNSGVANYRANRLDAARMDFNFAIDTMLTSGLDLKGDTEVAQQFEHLLDSINALEIAALKQGNGLSPKVEEAPLEAAEDITFAPNPELVARLRSELNTTSDLPLVINDQVAGYIGIFSASNSFRAHMAASLQRVGKYRGLIQRVLKEEGVPQDLIYLAVAESGFQPQALNRKSGAGGMWQFMTYTGPEYGLTRNSYYDYRFDPEKSSRAYARYIKKLYGITGDWYLAMASYDWGLGNVQRAVQRTGYADFWELYRRNAMPAETRAYVPQILAAVLMAKNPEKYGLDKLVPSPPVIYDTVSTSYGIDLHLVADVTGSTVQELVALNPALLRLSTPRDVSFDLHIPPGTKDLYAERLKDIPEDRRASWRFHIVKAGETVDSIASALHARAADIVETNGITQQDPLALDDELVVPIQAVATAAHPQRYTLRRGDTLVTVADSFNVSVEDLRLWNKLSSSSLRPGRTLYVAEPVRLAASTRARGRSSRGRRGSSGRSARRSSARGSAGVSRGAKSAAKGSSKRAAKGSTRSTAKGAVHAKAGSGKHKHG